jgi:hypothetical protein
VVMGAFQNGAWVCRCLYTDRLVLVIPLQGVPPESESSR